MTSSAFRPLSDYPESEGWNVLWKSQSIHTATDLRDDINRTCGRTAAVAQTTEPALPYAVVEQTRQYASDFPASEGWRFVGATETSSQATVLCRAHQGTSDFAFIVRSGVDSRPWAVIVRDSTQTDEGVSA